MAKKPAPPSRDSSSSSSSSDSEGSEESSPPVFSPLESPAGTNATDQRKQTEPLSDSTVDGEEDDSSDSEDSPGDSPAVAAKIHPPPPQHASQSAVGKQTSNAASSSESSSEEGEDSEEEDSSSESDQPPPPPPKETGNAGEAAVVEEEDGEDDDEESEPISESYQTAHPRRSTRSVTDPLLKPISSKPMDSPAKPLEKGPINGKQPWPSSAPFSEKKKKKTAAGDGAEGQQEKKELPRSTRNMESISESDQTAHPRRSARDPTDPLLKPISSKPMDSPEKPLEKGPINGKRPVPSPVPFSDKKKKKTAAGDGPEGQREKKERPRRSRNTEDQIMLNAGIQHDKERNNIVPSKFSEEYPSLHEFVMREHASKNSLLRFGVIPKEKAIELDKKCKKLVIAEVQLHKKKHNILADALQLITNALAERR